MDRLKKHLRSGLSVLLSLFMLGILVVLYNIGNPVLGKSVQERAEDCTYLETNNEVDECFAALLEECGKRKTVGDVIDCAKEVENVQEEYNNEQIRKAVE